MDKETWAVAIAIAGASVSLLTLAWQLQLYRLTGARLLLKLEPVVMDSNGRWVRGPEGGWDARQRQSIDLNLTPWRIDVARVSISNIGRAAVTASAIGLDFGPDAWHRPWKERHTIEPQAVADIENSSTGSTARLEPGAVVSYYFFPWRAFQAKLAEPHRNPWRRLRERLKIDREPRICVRATATIAGVKTKRSPWRDRWLIQASRWRLHQPDAPEQDRAEMEAFEELWMHLGYQDLSRIVAGGIWDVILPLMRQSKDADQILPHVQDAIFDYYGPEAPDGVSRAITAAVRDASEIFARFQSGD